MAKFVLAGKADCPFYAKAELLADKLQGSLPNFSIHKICIHPDEWEEWLEVTCRANGWKHQQSPLIWRDLVHRGGKGMLLGGFSDFLEHCQDYYNITLEMPTDLMLKIAAENLETKMKLIVEEERRVSLLQPFHIWITSALSPACHMLIPDLLSSDVFPHVSAVSLHLLDLDGDEEALQGLRMETEDMALPLLHQVTVHTDLEQAFEGADVILLLDDRWPDGGDAEKKEEDEEEEEKRRQVRRISERYLHYGRLIAERAKREVKLIVAGDSFANLRCSVLLDNAHSIDSCRFVTVATQLEYEARAVIAKKLKVRTSDITDVIVWGNISGSFYVDLQRAKVFNFDGAIKGPAFFSQPVLEMLYDRKWLETEFQDLVGCRRADVVSKTRQGAAMSAVNGILAVLKAWNGACGQDEVLSLGVKCQGHYNLPDGIVFSIPVTFKDGKWSPLPDVTIQDEMRERLQLSADELRQEKELGSES
ncbi:putative malate dehydrogenase 1B [Myripristis murdjan]|uniref:Malate dehydrogenase 1B, NAD (soluble) n=1 Tax=Myripristis murdjan TaxID=586833 RepID=A0A668A202_9TELE|nr:putative malate dehydrogenase 1B [Myripristis murdjan]